MKCEKRFPFSHLRQQIIGLRPMSYQTKIFEKLVVWFKCFSSNSELILSDKQHLMRLLMNLSGSGGGLQSRSKVTGITEIS